MTKTKVRMEVVEEISRRLVLDPSADQAIKVDTGGPDRPSWREAMVMHLFNLLDIVCRNPSSHNDFGKNIKQVLVDILESTNVPSLDKIRVVEYLTGFVDVYTDLQGFLEEHATEEPLINESLVEKVFREIDKRYLEGSKNIYEYEENPFHVLARRWSGNPSGPEVEKIQGAAERGLVDKPLWISMWWKSYDSILNPSDEATRSRLFICMPVEKLIEITNQCSGVLDDSLKSTKTRIETMLDGPKREQLTTIRPLEDTLIKSLISKKLMPQSWADTVPREH
ncbi:MAG: hypothetical protein KDD48_06065 [Bdellovibrionales bacterium]|nr:hypothetical protein [Bdellovibrionales bacterium]